MKKQDLIKGTFILAAGTIISKFLGVFFRYPIILLLGDEGIAFYQLVFPLHMFFMGFAYGIPIAMSKLISESRAMNKNEQGSILSKGLLFMAILGGGFSTLLILFSNEIINFLKWNPGSYYAFLGISFAPFIIGILSVFRGYFQGMQNMYPSAISQIIEQIGRVIFGVGLAYILISRGPEVASGGAALGTCIGGIFALIFLIIYFMITKDKKQKIIEKESGNFLKKILDIAIPISIGASVPAIMALIDSIVIPQRLAVAGFNYVNSAILYGQLTGKASVLINVPLTLSMALNTSIVPILSEYFILKNYKEINRKSQIAYKFSFAISLPATIGLFLLSNQILALIFPGSPAGGDILKWSSLMVIFIMLFQTTSSILQAIGKENVPVKHLIIGCIFKFTLSWFLTSIPQINIFGSIIGSIVGYLIPCIMNLIVLRKTINNHIDVNESLIKPLISTATMAFCLIVLYNFLKNTIKNINLLTIVVVIISAFIYIFVLIITGVLDYHNIVRKLEIQKR